MRYGLIIGMFLYSGICAAQGKSVRGATGTGYGQFSWGTSLSVVQELSPKLSVYRSAKDVQTEKKAIDRLKVARNARGASGWPADAVFHDAQSLAAYRHWTSVSGLKGRVELGFFQDQLYRVTLRLIVPHSKRAKVEGILQQLVRKYGSPTRHQTGRKPSLSELELHFKTPAGTIEFLRLKSTSKEPGFIKVSYRSEDLGAVVETHLERLEYLIARYAPHRSKPLPKRKKTPSKTHGRDHLHQKI